MKNTNALIALLRVCVCFLGKKTINNLLELGKELNNSRCHRNTVKYMFG